MTIKMVYKDLYIRGMDLSVCVYEGEVVQLVFINAARDCAFNAPPDILSDEFKAVIVKAYREKP
jgi:hypothetical protein